MSLDVRRYPRTAAYLAQLPSGLDSFPECEAKTTIHRTIYAHAAREETAKREGAMMAELEGLGPVLQGHLDAPARIRWMPQCHTLALILALVESRKLDKRAEPPWIRGAASSLFATPMYKVLMWAASPQLLYRGSNLRWSAFFRGSHLEAVVGQREATIDLVAPPGLFDVQLAEVFTDVLRAALDFTDYDKGDASIDLGNFAPGRIRYQCRW